MSGQTIHHLIPHMTSECELIPLNWMANKRKHWPPHTYTSGVNIPPKQTKGQTSTSRERSRHTLRLSAHPSSHTDTFSLSVATVSGDGSPFLHYLSDSHWSSCCASKIVLSMPCCLFISPMFPLVVFFGLLLWKQYAESHDDTAASHPWTLPLTYSGTFPENS